MKKFSNLIIALLVMFGIAACSDDNNSSLNNPSITDNEIIENYEFTARIGETKENTLTFTNPYNMASSLYVSFQLNNNYSLSNSSIEIDRTKSTCLFRDNINNSIEQVLQIGQSCTVVYNYTPSKIDTELLEVSIDYMGDMKAVCPTPNYRPTYQQILARQKFITKNIYHYAEDNSGNKSPKYINIDIPADVMINDYNNENSDIIPSYSKDFTLLAKQGEYTLESYNIYNITSNNDNCSIINNTLNVYNNNGCSLKATINSSYSGMIIKFIPKLQENPYYNVSINSNPKYLYYVMAGNAGSPLWIEYFATRQYEETDFRVGILRSGESISNYEITDINSDNISKFRVTGTKHYSCTVDDVNKTISIPQGENFCLWTVAIADTSESGEFNAQLKTTLNNTIKNYNLNGYIDTMTMEQYLNTVCQNVHQQPNQQSYKKLYK